MDKQCLVLKRLFLSGFNQLSGHRSLEWKLGLLHSHNWKWGLMSRDPVVESRGFTLSKVQDARPAT